MVRWLNNTVRSLVCFGILIRVKNHTHGRTPHDLGPEFSPDPGYVAGDVGVHARCARSTPFGAVRHETNLVPNFLNLVPDKRKDTL